MKFLCILGFHKYEVDRCTGWATYHGTSVWDWFLDDNFIFKCTRCGKEK